MTQDSEKAIVAEIEALQARRAAALVAGDTATLDWLMADDAMVFHGSGAVEKKAEFIPNLIRRLEIQKSWVRDATYRVRGDVVIENGFNEMIVRQKLKPGTDFYPATALMTVVWEHIDDRWRQVLMHQTRVPPDLSPK